MCPSSLRCASLGALHERGQLPSSPRGCDLLERRAASEHDPHNQPRQLFAERERADHRHQRDRIHPHVTFHGDRADHLDRELHREQHDRTTPDVIAEPTVTRKVCEPTGHQRSHCERRKDPSAMLDQGTPRTTLLPVL
jgi:hypothetical protein